MNTFRDVVYMIADQNKIIQDDSVLNEEHILYLASKYRNYILNANFKTPKQRIGDESYQTICIELEDVKSEECCNTLLLKSKQQVPYVMTLGSKQVNPPTSFICGRFTFVNSEQFKYSGYNKWLKNEIYVTIEPDNYLYIRSSNTNFKYLKKVRLTSLFEDIKDAALLECNENCEVINCDILDKRFPLEEEFIPTLIQAVSAHLQSASLTARDHANDAADDQDTLAQVMRNYLNTAGKNLAKGKTSE